MAKGKLRGPWGEVQNALSARDREIELKALLDAGLVDPPKVEKLQDRSLTPTEELSEDPAFLDKVFPKRKKKQ
jgi:hypothetical protein